MILKSDGATVASVKNVRGQVTIWPDRVEKQTAYPELTASKYQAIYEISSRCGFRAPRVIDVDVGRGIVILERIERLTSTREIYLECQRHPGKLQSHERLFKEIGAVLARLHRSLTGKASATIAFPSKSFALRLNEYNDTRARIEVGSPTFIHCDFSFANVFVTTATSGLPEIVVIDPCANRGSTFEDWECTSAYLDIGKFLSCLEGQVPILQQLWIRPEISCRLQSAFLSGYQAETGVPIDLPTAFSFSFAVASEQFNVRFGRFSAIRRSALFNGRWKRNFPLSIKETYYARMLKQH